MDIPVFKKALVIDDDSVSRKKLSRILQRLGIDQIGEANDGEEAMARIQEEPYDLVMVDWYMPGMTGLELLKFLREKEAYKQTPVFMVTSEDRRSPILEAIQAGANGYIIKPFSQEIIKRKLGDMLPNSSNHKKSTASHTLRGPESSQEPPEKGSSPEPPIPSNMESSMVESSNTPS